VSNIVPCNTNVSSDIVHDIVDNVSHNSGIVSKVHLTTIEIANSPFSDNVTSSKLCDSNDIASVFSGFVNTNIDYAFDDNGDNAHDLSRFVHTNTN
jgi:hypothetical protein